MNEFSNNVSVIATASNTVVATVPVGSGPLDVAVTPDGKHAYVTNAGSTNVSVIATATNTVGTPIPVGSGPHNVAIACVPFFAFSAKLDIDSEREPNRDHFELLVSFTKRTTSSGINPVTEPVTLQVGTFSVTIPPGSFRKHEHDDEDEHGFFSFEGVINGVRLEVLIKRTGTLRYAFDAKARHANLTGITNPVPVTLTIGDDCGTASVTARISH